MAKKVTVSLPDALLERLDAEAEALGLSRSGIVQEASAHYLAHTCDEREVQERRMRAGQTMAGFAGIAALPSMDERGSLDILREVRAGNDSTVVRHAGEAAG
jgi:predicted transcriptional regulator